MVKWLAFYCGRVLLSSKISVSAIGPELSPTRILIIQFHVLVAVIKDFRGSRTFDLPDTDGEFQGDPMIRPVPYLDSLHLDDPNLDIT